MKLLYFSATGNSMAVCKRLGGEMISIPQSVKENEYMYEDDVIGVVFPLYCLNPPKMVRKFLQKAKFNTDYLFAIATYGNGAGAAMENLQKFAGIYGYQFDYLNTLLMVDNFLPVFEMDAERTRLPQKNVEEHLAAIIADINIRKKYVPKAALKDKALSALCVPMMKNQDKGKAAVKFLVNEACIRCGVCAEVCPAGNISVTEQVMFGVQCESCYACIHACPQNAIHLKNEKSAARFRNPDVCLEELIAANRQK